MIKIKTAFIIIFSYVFFFPLMVRAQLIDSRDSTQYDSIDDLIVIAIKVANWILGVSAAAALLAFVIGGLMMILSGGNKNTVEKGKATLIGATIGLVIVFASFMIINFVMDLLGYKSGVFGDWKNVKSWN